MTEPECANCGAALAGPFCSACGQHAHESARSVGVLFHDAWHVVTHIDGRFWRTISTLLLRPGRLTQDYFAERRARYLPPVRVYLVLSLIFFAFGTFAPRGAADSGAAWPEGGANAPARAAGTADHANAGDAIDRAKDAGGGFNVDFKDCDKIESSFKWLKAGLIEACKRHVNDGGKPILGAFIANVPKMMFVFLPVMALVMLALYWRPRRYYVEHLVFFLHTHAAIFLILLLERLLSWVLPQLPVLRRAGGLLTFFAAAYALWYVYKAMRVYYLQGRWLTLAKFLVVGFAYVVFLATTLLATLLISALTA